MFVRDDMSKSEMLIECVTIGFAAIVFYAMIYIAFGMDVITTGM